MTSSPKPLALAALLALTACGGIVVFESDGGGGEGGFAATTSATTTSGTVASATDAEGTVASATTATGDGGAGASVVSVSDSGVTDVAVTDGVGGGLTRDTPCEAECEGDPGCDLVPPSPLAPCEHCIQTEVEAFTDSPCLVEGLLGSCCQDRPDCADFVSCILADGNDCPDDNPDGAERARACVYQRCGDCGHPR